MQLWRLQAPAPMTKAVEDFIADPTIKKGHRLLCQEWYAIILEGAAALLDQDRLQPVWDDGAEQVLRALDIYTVNGIERPDDWLILRCWLLFLYCQREGAWE